MLEASSSQKLRFEEEPKPFYFLELYGETSPQVDPDYAQVVATKGTSNAGPIYEYFWTLGRYDPPQLDESEKNSQQIPKAFGTSTVRIFTFTPPTSSSSSGWGEFGANSFSTGLCAISEKQWLARTRTRRLGQIPIPCPCAEILAAGDGQGPLRAATVARRGGNGGRRGRRDGSRACRQRHRSCPGCHGENEGGQASGSAPGFEWSVKKFTTWAAQEPSGADSASKTATPGELVDGIVWNIPPAMLEMLGSRINGSIAVSVLPLSSHNPGKGPSSVLKPGIVRARATLPLDWVIQ